MNEALRVRYGGDNQTMAAGIIADAGGPDLLGWSKRMDKPRIFLGSSGKQKKLLQALTRGLEDIAYVEPWTTSFNPGSASLSLRVKSTSLLLCSPRTTGRVQASRHHLLLYPLKLLRETMWSSKPAFLAVSSECAERLSSMPTAPSFQAISSA
jgi:hypothetical protein